MNKIIASVSFGKDSLAMLLKIIETDMLPINEVVFYDTGMEFKSIYAIRDRVKIILAENNIKYTELKPNKPFLYTMLEKPVNHRNGTKSNGYQWCGGCCRWGTTEKLKALDKYCKYSIQLIGIAYDEPKRLSRINKAKNKLAPLISLKMTEKDCLEYCYSKGFYWEEDGIRLYDILDRVSCWCCGNKNLKELKNYQKYLPEYWNKLKDLQGKIDRPFKGKYTIFDLEEKFKEQV